MTKSKKKLEDVRSQGLDVFISCIAYYEVKRGLLYANATRQLSDLNELCRQYRVLFLDDIEIIERACEIHANLKKRGTPIQEADILIAATSKKRGLILVSHDSEKAKSSGDYFGRLAASRILSLAHIDARTPKYNNCHLCDDIKC